MFSQEEIRNVEKNQYGCLTGYAANKSLAVYAPSVPAYIQHVINAYPQPKHEGSSSKSGGRYSDFHSISSWDEMVETYTTNPSSLVQFTEVEERLRTWADAGNEVFFDVTGDYIDIGRYLDGEPEHWGNAVLGNPRSVFATIYFGLTSAGYVSEKVIVHRTKRMIALVDWLETQHIRTAIRAISKDTCAYADVFVKNYHEALDINNVAVAAHTDFYRRLVFRQIEWSPTYRMGYGDAFQTINPEPQGITIISKWQDNVAAVDKFWDGAIEKIKTMIENGERHCTIM